MFENLGNKLKILRVQNHLSRKQVGELVGVSTSMVGLYESGDRLPSLHILVKLATQYKVSVDYLLDTDTNTKETLSLEGLTPSQVKALKMTIECFRSPNNG